MSESLLTKLATKPVCKIVSMLVSKAGIHLILKVRLCYRSILHYINAAFLLLGNLFFRQKPRNNTWALAYFPKLMVASCQGGTSTKKAC